VLPETGAGYLRRDPDSGPNANFDGYSFWPGKPMVKAFITSTEYTDRFGSRL
jgi:hypothetical protein